MHSQFTKREIRIIDKTLQAPDFAVSEGMEVKARLSTAPFVRGHDF